MNVTGRYEKAPEDPSERENKIRYTSLIYRALFNECPGGFCCRGYIVPDRRGTVAKRSRVIAILDALVIIADS